MSTHYLNAPADIFATPTSTRDSASPPYDGPPPSSPPPIDPNPAGPGNPTPWWQRDGVISRILVVAGVVVTLAGVVMLLVLAAQNGLLLPQVRVAGGAVLAAALLAAGWRVLDRPGGRIGGSALMATGFAGLYLDVLAMTAWYDWVQPEVGLVLAFLVAMVGIAVAMRRDLLALAVIVNLGAAALAPFLTGGLTLTLVAFLIVFAVTGAVPELVRGWSVMAPIRTAPAVLAASGGLVDLVVSGPTSHDLLAAATIAVVALVTGLAAARKRPHDVLALGTMTVAFLPAFIVGAALDSLPAAAWFLTMALVTAAGTAAAGRLTTTAYVVVGLIIAFAVIAATSVLSVGYSSALPFLVLAILLLAADLTRPNQLVHATGQTALGLGWAYLAVEVTFDSAIEERLALALSPSVALSGVLTVAAATLGAIGAMRARGTTRELRGMLLSLDAFIAFYAGSAALLAVGVNLVAGRDGFALGQFLITASWMAVAYAALLVGLRRPQYARVALTGGLLLAGTALAKLFVFDLAAIGGVARAAAFLVVGLLLLVAGTRYARSFAERDASEPVDNGETKTA